MLVDRLSTLPRTSSLEPAQARLVGAIRAWVVAHRQGAVPAQALKNRLGSARGCPY